jgi:WD40 repeat protein
VNDANALVDGLAPGPDGHTLAGGVSVPGGGPGDRVRVWRSVSQESVRNRVLNESASAVALSPDGQRLASITDSAISLWDVRSGRRIGSVPASGLILPSDVAFTPDGREVVVA